LRSYAEIGIAAGRAPNYAASRAGTSNRKIQMLLGHASIQTTEKYLGMQQNLVEAVNDKLGIVDANE
jgi:integrase